jgi:hypothetical protein
VKEFLERRTRPRILSGGLRAGNCLRSNDLLVTNQLLQRVLKLRAFFPAAAFASPPHTANHPGSSRTLTSAARSKSAEPRRRTECAEALQILQELAQKEPETYQPDVAKVLNILAALDSEQRRMSQARMEYADALRIYESFAHKRPEQYAPDVRRIKRLLAKIPNTRGS